MLTTIGAGLATGRRVLRDARIVDFEFR
jgi:hypothetical protein